MHAAAPNSPLQPQAPKEFQDDFVVPSSNGVLQDALAKNKALEEQIATLKLQLSAFGDAHVRDGTVASAHAQPAAA